MERIARNSWGKLLAFVLAFALVLATLLAFLPFTAKALPGPEIKNVYINMTMPAVGAKASTVSDGNISFEIYDEDGASVEIEDIDDVEITVWEDDKQSGYVIMASNDVFDVDGLYAITISLSDDDKAKMVGDPYVCFNGLDEYCEHDLSYWDGTDSHMFILEDIEFCTITFDSAGGSEVEPINVIWGDYAYEPQEPTREGYVFYDWLDEDGYYFDWYYPVDDDYNLTAKWAPVHGVISGDNQTFYLESGDDVVISFDANYDDFDGLWIYNSETGEIVDLSKGGYMVTKGSTVLTLSNALLKTMEAGTYNIELIFEGDDENISYAYATLNIAEGAAPSTSPATPQTGDNANVIALAGIAGAAAVGLTVIVAYRKKVTE